MIRACRNGMHPAAPPCGCLLAVLFAAGAPAADPPDSPAPPAAAAANPSPAASTEQLTEVIVETAEPRYVAPTRRDRIGRIWAPVLIDGKGPYRLVLDTGANRSAITVHTAQMLGATPVEESSTRVTGFTGAATVPTVHVQRLEVGELLFGPSDLPVLADVFGGAQGVLSVEGLANKRIYADFTRDYLEISHSRGERARRDFTVVPLRVINGGLLVADVRVGNVRAKAIIDTGGQTSIANIALRDALERRAREQQKQADRIEDVTKATMPADSVDSPPIQIEVPNLGKTIQISNDRLMFADMAIFQRWKLQKEPAVLIGMNTLGQLDILIIDYMRQELQIRMNGDSGA